MHSDQSNLKREPSFSQENMGSAALESQRLEPKLTLAEDGPPTAHPIEIAYLEKPEREDYPAWKPYAALLAGFCALFSSFGYTSSFGIYQTWYAERFPHVSSSVVSLVGGLQVAVQYSSGLFVGRAVDRFGPKPVTAAGAFCCTLALMMLSITNSMWQVFLTQGVLFGLGMASLFMPVVAAALTWFDKRKTVAAAVVLSGSGAGGVVWPILVKNLRDKAGWGWTNRTIGFIVLALTTVTATLIEPRQKPKTGISLVPDFSLFKRPEFSFLVLANFFGYFSVFSIFFFIEVRAQAVGMSPSLTPYMVSILNGSGILLRFIPALSADHFGPLNTWIAANALCALVLFCVWIPIDSTAGVVAVAVLWALCAGGWVGVLPSCVPRVAGPENVASSMGVFYASSVPGALAGSSIGGVLLNGRQSGFRRAGIFWGCTQLACLACAICARLAKNRKLIAKE